MIRHNDVTFEQTNLIVAKNLKSRLLGLLVYKQMPPDTLMCFPYTQSIHTFFMKFPIDVIFINAEFKVTKIISHLSPGRLGCNFALQVRHVIEAPCGWVSQKKIKVGDQFYVDM
jgi:uncharacterized protein